MIDKETATELTRDIYMAVVVFGLFGITKKVNIVGLYLVLKDFARHKNVDKNEFIEFVGSLHNKRLHEHLFLIDDGYLQLM